MTGGEIGFVVGRRLAPLAIAAEATALLWLIRKSQRLVVEIARELRR